MTRLLLDTCALLWFVFDDQRLSQRVDRAISDGSVEKMVGICSLWEIVIKQQLGKLGLGMRIEEFFDRFVFDRELTVVHLETEHLLAYSSLPMAHRDPFDRILIAQAIHFGVPVATPDSSFDRYDVARVW